MWFETLNTQMNYAMPRIQLEKLRMEIKRGDWIWNCRFGGHMGGSCCYERLKIR